MGKARPEKKTNDGQSRRLSTQEQKQRSSLASMSVPRPKDEQSTATAARLSSLKRKQKVPKKVTGKEKNGAAQKV